MFLYFNLPIHKPKVEVRHLNLCRKVYLIDFIIVSFNSGVLFFYISHCTQFAAEREHLRN